MGIGSPDINLFLNLSIRIGINNKPIDCICPGGGFWSCPGRSLYTTPPPGSAEEIEGGGCCSEKKLHKNSKS